jgi:hypothetical protein
MKPTVEAVQPLPIELLGYAKWALPALWNYQFLAVGYDCEIIKMKFNLKW